LEINSMPNQHPLRVIALALGGVVAIGVIATALGIGPLAGATPPSEVTDPKEMVARSVQATLDATAVHLEGTLSGTIPGALVDRPEAAVSLEGTTVDGDIRPKDAKTRAHVASPGMEVDADTVTVWDGVWFRTGPDEAWQRASLGSASAEAGVDINPLTLVERLRSYLATPGITPTVEEVACASASGRCHRVVIDAGRDPAIILRPMHPAAQAETMPDVRTTVTLDTDAETLRPARLLVDAVSDDGSVDLHLVLDAGRWDDPVIQIEEPPASAG
jgi:hypothetical protein